MISFKNVSKSFKGSEVLKNLDLEIKKGEIVALIGESGCGKTTTLKMINRLINPTIGEVLINGENVKKLNVIELRRKIGYVIQQTGLFPHMTIRDNIELIPKAINMDIKKINENTINLMNMIGLDPDIFLSRYPNQLSGGQQQRVGVARAFANNPDIILMDEPFSALDPITRSDLQNELVELQIKMNKTIVFVTHDMDEAIKIADKICIMDNGRILQYDTPENILKHPENDFVENFVGKNRIWSSPEHIRVLDIMIENPLTCTLDLIAFKCMEVMRKNRVDSLIVVEPKTKMFKGVVYARKIRDLSDKSIPASSIMVTNIHTIHPFDSFVNALKIVNDESTPIIPVVDESNKLRGLITKSSLVTTMSQQYLDMEVE